jgi:hypothetical protein
VISLASVTFDETEFTPQGDRDNVRVWICPTGDPLGLFFYSTPPDIEADLDNQDELRNFYRATVEAEGLGIIEVDRRQIDGCQAISTIFKVPQEPSGRTYLGSLTLPFADFSFVFKVQCAEVETTGQRDSMVFQDLLSNGQIEIDHDAGSITGWIQDPYDPTLVSALTMNQSERAEYDSLFPDHPLSRARRILTHLEKTARLSPELKGSHRFVYTVG